MPEDTVPTQTAQDEFDQFGDLGGEPTEEALAAAEEIHTTEIVETDQNVEVGFKFPKGTDPSIIRDAMQHVGKITADRVKAKSSMDASREEYRKTGHRRWKCIVESMQYGVDFFELYIPHPDTDKPVRVQGPCGVLLEEGLTQYAINALNSSYEVLTEPDRNVDRSRGLGITHKTRRVPKFRVTVQGEVLNPQRVGTINSKSKR